MRTVGFANERKGVSFDTVLMIGVISMIIIATIAVLILTTGRTHAEDDSVFTDAAVTVASSCRVNATVDSAHTADVTASTYKAGIGKTTISVACNDSNGFAVYAIGYTNAEYGRNDMLGSGTGRTIATGTATSGDASNWAMKLNAVSGTATPTIMNSYDVYHAVPNEYQKVAQYADSTMSSQTGSQFEATYAVYAASLQVADTYRGKVKYTMMHPIDQTISPCLATYTISYANNGGAGTMDGQTACTGIPVTIASNVFTAPSPTAETQFAVWNTAADGSGYTYLPGQSIANLADAGGAVTLYAQWAPKYIQDLTASTCSTTANVAPLTVIDRRDENSYTVRYLQGACWMTQNLRIVGAIRSEYSNFHTYSTVNVCEGDSANGGSHYATRCHDSGTTSKGVWYNYVAASAKTITGDYNDTLATEDICPSGWSLPSYDTNATAGSVNSMAGVDAPTISAFSPVSGGHYSENGTIINPNESNWWSTAGVYNRNRYTLHGTGLSVSNTYRINSQYIRCVRTQ